MSKRPGRDFILSFETPLLPGEADRKLHTGPTSSTKTVYAKTANAPRARPKAAMMPPRETPVMDAPLAGLEAAAPAPVPVVGVLLADVEDRELVELLVLAAAMGTAMCSCKEKVSPNSQIQRILDSPA